MTKKSKRSFQRGLIIALMVLSFAGFYFTMLRSCGSNEFQYQALPSGITYSTKGLTKRITFFKENSVRVSVTREGLEFRDSTLVAISRAMEGGFRIRSGKPLDISF